MKIRDYRDTDWDKVYKIHADSDLPENCLADATSPLFIIRRVIEHEGEIAMAAFVRITSEPFLLVNKDIGTPETRWDVLRLLLDDVCRIARTHKIEQMTAWVPPELQVSFGKRLEQLGFMRSPWSSYTLNL